MAKLWKRQILQEMCVAVLFLSEEDKHGKTNVGWTSLTIFYQHSYWRKTRTAIARFSPTMVPYALALLTPVVRSIVVGSVVVGSVDIGSVVVGSVDIGSVVVGSVVVAFIVVGSIVIDPFSLVHCRWIHCQWLHCRWIAICCHWIWSRCEHPKGAKDEVKQAWGANS